jgi:hypothetical protein
MTKTPATVAAPAFTADDLGFLQIASSKVLAAIANGTLDLNALAVHALADRGLDTDQKWVGFATAADIATDLVGPYAEIAGAPEREPARIRPFARR